MKKLLLILLIAPIISFGQMDYYVSAKGGLNVREAPNLKAKKVATLLYGQKVTIESKTGVKLTLNDTDKKTGITKVIEGEWVEITSGEKIRGYVFNGFLKGFDLSKNMLPIYLDKNQITIKCPDADIGYRQEVNGITYTVVDNETIREEITNGNVNLCTTLVTDMSGNSKDQINFFIDTSFNSDISFWDTSAVTNMFSVFIGATSFNGDISNWDTSKVEYMTSMFYGATSFNGDISNWNTAAVTYMASMFGVATAFNRDISNWDTAAVTNMASMFALATAFNRDISNWNTAAVTDMDYMFTSASAFNQDLTGWCVSGISSEPVNFATISALTNANKPVWGTCP